MSYPTDIALRRARRAVIRRQIMDRAEREIARTGKSIVCGEYGQHETCAGPVHCICECHDPQEDA